MINIYTDGAYDQNTKTAGWAYYIENGRVMRGVGTVSDVKCPLEAEMIAIKMAVNHLDLPASLLFWCDAINVCNMLHKSKRKYNHLTKHRDYILQKMNGSRFYFNYLPRNSTPQHLWCDCQSKLAKLVR